MKCACCGRKKGLFESFEDISVQSVQQHICGDCSGLVYAIRGAQKEGNQDALNDLKKQLYDKMKRGKNKQFSDWFQGRLTAWENGER